MAEFFLRVLLEFGQDQCAELGRAQVLVVDRICNVCSHIALESSNRIKVSCLEFPARALSDLSRSILLKTDDRRRHILASPIVDNDGSTGVIKG